LQAYHGKPDVVVLGLPRGGIPVAWEVAAGLDAPLDAFVDTMIHIEASRALEPLELTSQWIAGEVPETYPTGL
jgi:hypothetical protein